MLADISFLSPIRESASSKGAQRRREDKLLTQKVLPRQQNHAPTNEEKSGQDQTRNLDAYA